MVHDFCLPNVKSVEMLSWCAQKSIKMGAKFSQLGGLHFEIHCQTFLAVALIGQLCSKSDWAFIETSGQHGNFKRVQCSMMNLYCACNLKFKLKMVS